MLICKVNIRLNLRKRFARALRETRSVASNRGSENNLARGPKIIPYRAARITYLHQPGCRNFVRYTYGDRDRRFPGSTKRDPQNNERRACYRTCADTRTDTKARFPR